jgi:hypothetical protein
MITPGILSARHQKAEAPTGWLLDIPHNPVKSDAEPADPSERYESVRHGRSRQGDNIKAVKRSSSGRARPERRSEEPESGPSVSTAKLVA